MVHEKKTKTYRTAEDTTCKVFVTQFWANSPHWTVKVQYSTHAKCDFNFSEIKPLILPSIIYCLNLKCWIPDMANNDDVNKKLMWYCHIIPPEKRIVYLFFALFTSKTLQSISRWDVYLFVLHLVCLYFACRTQTSFWDWWCLHRGYFCLIVSRIRSLGEINLLKTY